ncbi:hypothetical protein DESC_730036 [Desulfosarcina cetonica]|nr:hypothetical protein DESC_730036 [Desulfosarcina cetonica]
MEVVGQAAGLFVISSGNDNLFRPQPVENKNHGTRRAAGTDDQRLFTGNVKLGRIEGIHDADGVGVVPLELPALANDGVHGADDVGTFGKNIQVGQHGLLEGCGNVGAGDIEHPQALQGLADAVPLDHERYIGPLDARSMENGTEHFRGSRAKDPLITDDAEYLGLVFNRGIQNA